MSLHKPTPATDLYENGRVFVCTLEPYHENSSLLGTATRLSEAMALCGYPDPDLWQRGSDEYIPTPGVPPQPGHPRSFDERRTWYTTQGEYGADMIPKIVECPVFGPFSPPGEGVDLLDPAPRGAGGKG